MVNGAVAGLVSITPACGYVNPTASFFIGTIGGVVCYFASQLKYRLRIDDALDAFGVHAVGGIVGGILTGFFSNKNINGTDGVFYAPFDVGMTQVWKQIFGIIVVVLWACSVSLILLLGLKYSIGLRVRPEVELNGLDKKFFREEIASHPHRTSPGEPEGQQHSLLGEIAMNVLHLPHFHPTQGTLPSSSSSYPAPLQSSSASDIETQFRTPL
jgi:ammonia channel protein AmtB